MRKKNIYRWYVKVPFVKISSVLLLYICLIKLYFFWSYDWSILKYKPSISALHCSDGLKERISRKEVFFNSFILCNESSYFILLLDQSLCTFFRISEALIKPYIIVSFCPRILGEKSGFSKGFCLGGKSLFEVPGEKEFWRGLWIYWFLSEGKSDFWQVIVFLGISDMKNQNFLQPW